MPNALHQLIPSPPLIHRFNSQSRSLWTTGSTPTARVCLSPTYHQWWSPCQSASKWFSSQTPTITYSFGPLLVSTVIGWILWKQRMRWRLTCRMFIRDQHLWQAGEEAGLGRERSPTVMAGLTKPQPIPQGALECVWSVSVIPAWDRVTVSYIYIHTYIYIYMYIYTYTHTYT